MRHQTLKSFQYWQIRTIAVTMAGYALYYFVRKNFSLAMPGLNAEFGLSKVQLGLFLTLNGVIYGLSRFINGFVTDRHSARKVMAIGLLVCALINMLFGYSDSVANWIIAKGAGYGYAFTFSTVLVFIMGIMWLINGYFQGMGVPPCHKLLAHWIHPAELATKMSVWNMSHSIGAGLVVMLCGYIMSHFGSDLSDNAEVVSQIAGNLNADLNDPAASARVMTFASHFYAWRWCFIVPAFISLSGAAGLWLSLRDNPSAVGLPEIIGEKKIEKKRSEEEKAAYKKLLREKVFGNRLIWTLALTNFFIYIVRFAALDWGPTLLSESKGISLVVAGVMVAVFELAGGNIGMLVAGWATDHIFGSRAHRTCVFCLGGTILAIAAFWIIPAETPKWVFFIPFTLIGFFLYGPQALLGIAAANQATNKAAASANGILGIFGYASTLISGVGFGYIAQHYGWDLAYVAMIGVAVLGIITLLTMWNAKADGYDQPRHESDHSIA